MKLSSTRILLLTVAILSTLSSSVIAISSQKQLAAPSKDNLEEILGQPIKCPSDSDEGVCYDKEGTLLIARFNSSGFAERILMSTSCVGIFGLTKLANQIAPKNSRGKPLRRVDKTKIGDCETRYAEEYEFLTMKYYEFSCQGCAPASIRIIWKP